MWQLRYLSAEELMLKMWCVHTIECYLAVKRNRIYRGWMELGTIIVNEATQTHKNKRYILALICTSLNTCVEFGVPVEVRKSESDMERVLRKGDSRTQGEREIMPQEVIVEWGI